MHTRKDPSFSQYLHVILKREWLVPGVSPAFLAHGRVRNLLTPLYSATARIPIHCESFKVVEGGAVTLGEDGSSGFLRTQDELLKGGAPVASEGKSLLAFGVRETGIVLSSVTIAPVTGPPAGEGDRRKGIIRSALRRLHLARVTLIGTVLTRFNPKTAGYACAYSCKYGYGL